MIFRHQNFRWLVSRVTILCVLLLSHHSLHPRLLMPHTFHYLPGRQIITRCSLRIKICQEGNTKRKKLELIELIEWSGNVVPKIEVNLTYHTAIECVPYVDWAKLFSVHWVAWGKMQSIIFSEMPSIYGDICGRDIVSAFPVMFKVT